MNTLQIAAESPWYVHAGAGTILVLHIAGGSVAILAGGVALALRKGGPRHALAGNIFFVSMLVMAGIGGLVAPFLLDARGAPKLFDSSAGLFTCYLVATGWMTVKRKAGTIGRFEPAAFAFASLLSAWIVFWGTRAPGDPSRFYVMGGVIALAAAFDLKVILSGGIGGSPRLARHLWRMCAALFVASGSFFLGQQRQMPDYLQGSPWLSVPAFAPIVVMAFWLLRLRLARPLARLRQWLPPRRIGLEA